MVTDEKNVAVIRNYKDTVFRMLFKQPRELLELFNAVNGTNYTDEHSLEIMTLENAVYMSVKNDISCILDMRLQLYEQQSTFNPNMPLRDLIYLSRQLEKLILDSDIYSTRQIRIPMPQFFVFYNGETAQPERKELKLSDAYRQREAQREQLEAPYALELKVIQFNINDGYNTKLKESCPTLLEYMIYVDKIRTYRKKMRLQDAVQQAVNECIRENVLRDFLLKNKAGVISMSIFEYDEELHKRTLLQEGREDAREQLLALIQHLKKDNQLDQLEQILENPDLIEELCKKYNI